MFLVLEGQVIITRAGQHLATLGPGETFGEMALLDAPIRSASALVSRESRLLALGRHRFHQLVHEHPVLGAWLQGAMVRRLSTVIRAQNLALWPSGKKGSADAG